MINKNQRKQLEEALQIVEAVKIEIEGTVDNLEESFPNSSRLESIQDEYERLDTICTDLDSLVND